MADRDISPELVRRALLITSQLGIARRGVMLRGFQLPALQEPSEPDPSRAAAAVSPLALAHALPTGVTHLWRPTPTDGWWPKFTATPHGIYVAYGHAGVYVDALGNVLDAQRRYIDKVAKQGFIRPGVLSYTVEASPLTSGRYELDVLSGVVTKQADDPTLASGNAQIAEDGHWATWSAARGNIVLDGTVLGAGYGFAMAGVEPWIASVTRFDQFGQSAEITRWRGRQGAARYQPQGPVSHLVVGPQGHVLYSEAGQFQVYCIDPDGSTRRVERVPKLLGAVRLAEVPVRVIAVGNQQWLISIAFTTTASWLLAGPLGSKDVVTVEWPIHGCEAYSADGRTIYVGTHVNLGRQTPLDVFTVDTSVVALRSFTDTSAGDPPVVIPAVTPIGRDLWWAPYWKYRTTSDGVILDKPGCPGNACIMVDRDPTGCARAFAAGDYVIPDDTNIEFCVRNWNRVPYVYVAAEDASPSAAAIAVMKMLDTMRRVLVPERKVITYTRDFNHTLGKNVVNGIQCYFTPDQTHDQIRDYIRARLADKPADAEIALIWQMYNRSDPGWTEQKLAAIQPVASEFAARDTRIKVVAPFAWVRTGGGADFPLVADQQRKMFATVTGRPAVETVGQPDPPPPPTVRYQFRGIPHDMIMAVMDYLEKEIYTPAGVTPPHHVPHPLDMKGVGVWAVPAIGEVLAPMPWPGDAAGWTARVETAKTLLRQMIGVPGP